MWCTVLASALLGAGAVLVNGSDSGGHQASKMPAKSKAIPFDPIQVQIPGSPSWSRGLGETGTGVTCRLRPGQFHRAWAALPCGGTGTTSQQSTLASDDADAPSFYYNVAQCHGAVTIAAEGCTAADAEARLGLASLLFDDNALGDVGVCHLVDLDAIEPPGTAYRLNMAFCNQTQIDALIGLFPEHHDGATAGPKVELAPVIEITLQRGKIEGSHPLSLFEVPARQLVLDTELRPFLHERNPSSASPRKWPEATPDAWPSDTDLSLFEVEDLSESNLLLPPPSTEAATAKDVVGESQGRFDTETRSETSATTTPMPSPNVKSTNSNTTRSGSMHLTGMAAALAGVMLIFFVWL